MSSCIWLIRHGETAWSRELRHTGRTDIPLTDLGIEQAAAAGSKLSKTAAALVLCSPLGRARDTAAIADLVVDEYTEDLLEWDYGAWEGLTTQEIRLTLGDPTWVVWNHPIPAGQTPGEQPAQVAARANRVITRAQQQLEEGGDCVLVAHGHVLRILTATWLGLPPNDGRLFGLDPARVSALGFEHEQRVILQWNS